jgi:hypothetical protein
VAALLLDPDVRLVIVTHKEVAELWLQVQSDAQAFLKAALPKLDQAFKGRNQEERGDRQASPTQRLFAQWQQVISLIELLEESSVESRRYQMIAHHPEEWLAIDNPYSPAVRSVKNSGCGIAAGHIAGLTWCSTSIIAWALHGDLGGTVDLLRKSLAPDTTGAGKGFREVLDKVLFGLPKEVRIIYLMTRCADENMQHNTTLGLVRQLLECVAHHNTYGTRRQYRVVPLEPHIVLKYGQKGSAEGAKISLDEIRQKLNEKLGAEILLPSLSFFAWIEKLDKRPWPQLATRSLITELWRCVAEDPRTGGLFGGRSGSLDIAAFMGVRPILCFDELTEIDYGNIRLLLTWRLMDIVNLTPKGHLISRGEIERFLRGEPQDVSAFPKMASASKGYHPALEVGEEPELGALGNAGPIVKKLTYLYWALLLYRQGEFPSAEAFFGGGGSSSSSPLRSAQAIPEPANVADFLVNYIGRPTALYDQFMRDNEFREGQATREGDNCLLHCLDQWIADAEKDPAPKGYQQKRSDLGLPEKGMLENDATLFAELTRLDLTVQFYRLNSEGGVDEAGSMGEGSRQRYCLHFGNHYIPLWKM